MFDFEKMGQFLQENRNALGYTQAFVEEKTGICEKTLQNIEYAKTETGLEYTFRLFAMYAIPAETVGNFFVLDENRECDRLLMEFLKKRNLEMPKDLVGAVR